MDGDVPMKTFTPRHLGRGLGSAVLTLAVALNAFPDAGHAQVVPTAADGSPGAVEFAPTVATPEATRLRLACDSGVASACYDLSIRFHGGDGVSRDNPFSVVLVAQACELGHAPACYDLGVRHLLGEYVPHDASLAIGHIRQACDGDYAVACYFAGVLLRDGVGIARARDAAHALMTRGCALGYWDACEEIEAGLVARQGGEESRVGAEAPSAVRRAARLCDAGLMVGCVGLADMETSATEARRLRSMACEWGMIDACAP